MRIGARTTIAVALLAVTLAAWPTVAGLELHWRTVKSYEHGYLVAVLAIGWLVLAITRHRQGPVQPTLRFVAALAVAMLMWLIAHTANINILHQLLWPLLLWLALLSVLGWRQGKSFIWPLGLWYFAIPVWDYLLPTLQNLSVAVTRVGMRLLDIPFSVLENRISIPDGTFVIEEGCSGLRYLMVALTIAYLGRATFGVRGWRLAAYLAVSAALALVTNWVRIAVVIYAGHVTHMQSYLVAVEHVTFGNVLFLPLLAAILWLGRRVSSQMPVGSLPQPVGAVSVAGASGAGLYWVLSLSLGLWLLPQLASRAPAGGGTAVDLPLSTLRWQGPLPGDPVWQPHFVGASRELTARYVNGQGATVHVYVNHYQSQAEGRELVTYANSLIGTPAWSYGWPRTLESLATGNLPPLSAEQARDASGHNWLVSHVYRVGSVVTRREIVAQLAYGTQSILRPRPAGVVAFAIQCEMNCESAHRVAVDFWSELSAQLLAVIPER